MEAYSHKIPDSYFRDGTHKLDHWKCIDYILNNKIYCKAHSRVLLIEQQNLLDNSDVNITQSYLRIL